MRLKISASDIFASSAESCQSLIFRPIDAARSPFPSPLAPWHMAQSKPKNFLASAKFSGVGLTGFVRSVEDVVSEETAASFGSCDGFCEVEFCCQAKHSNGTSRNPPEAGNESFINISLWERFGLVCGGSWSEVAALLRRIAHLQSC